MVNTLELAQSIVETVRDSLLILDGELRVKMANPAFYRKFQSSSDSTLNQYLYDLGSGQWNLPVLRSLLNQVIEDNLPIEEFEVEHNFPTIGRRVMLLNARRMQLNDVNSNLILLCIEDITERKQTEIANRESENRYRTLFEDSPISLWEEDFSPVKTFLNHLQAQGIEDIASYLDVHREDVFACLLQIKVLDVNRTSLKLFKANSKAELMDNLGRVAGDDAYAPNKISFMAIAAGKTNARFETSGYTLDGEKLSLDMSWSVSPGYEDTYGKVILSIIDITERKKTEEELKALYNATSYLFKADTLSNLSQQIAQAVVREFQQVDCGILLIDKEGQQLIRVAREGHYELQVTGALPMDGRGLVAEAARTGEIVYAPDTTIHPNYLSNDSRTRSELAIPLLVPKGIIGVLDLQSPNLDDFSDQNRRVLTAFAERAAHALEIIQLYEQINVNFGQLEWRVARRTAELQRAKERVEGILNHSSDALILTRANGEIEQTNPAFNQLFGFDFDGMFGQQLTALAAPECTEPLEEARLSVLNTLQPTRIEIRCYRKNNTWFDADVALSPIVAEDTGKKSVICSMRDITERKQMEENLRLALEKEKELGELKSRFVSMVSHEFRTPLATILSSGGLLRDFGDRLTEERKRGHLDKIQSQVQHLAGMLDSVLTISKAETVGLDYNPVQIDLVAFCADMVEEFQTLNARHKLDFNVIGTPTIVNADTKLMRQILDNLLSNAIKYSPAGGTVRFCLEYDDTQVMMRVQDQGIGIPQDDIPLLFNVFHRATNVGTIQGTGLGLPIVKQAVERQGGTIAVESAVGSGTQFTITLPIAGI